MTTRPLINLKLMSVLQDEINQLYAIIEDESLNINPDGLKLGDSETVKLVRMHDQFFNLHENLFHIYSTCFHFLAGATQAQKMLGTTDDFFTIINKAFDPETGRALPKYMEDYVELTGYLQSYSLIKGLAILTEAELEQLNASPFSDSPPETGDIEDILDKVHSQISAFDSALSLCLANYNVFYSTCLQIVDAYKLGNHYHDCANAILALYDSEADLSNFDPEKYIDDLNNTAQEQLKHKKRVVVPPGARILNNSN